MRFDDAEVVAVDGSVLANGWTTEGAFSFAVLSEGGIAGATSFVSESPPSFFDASFCVLEARGG